MIWMEGNILSAELLDKLPELNGQQPEDFGLKKSERLADEISRCWADAKDLWRIFNRRIENLSEEETGTTETRNIWMVPFLQNLLGYQLQLKPAEEVDGLSFAISHRDTHLDSFPIHIIGCNQKLDKRYERQRQSAHSLMQDYLNRTEYTYGIIANGNSIRLLRDSARLIKQQFVEWDMKRIIEEDRYTDFVFLFRLLHSTRMPQKCEATSESILEQYHQTSIDEGNRIRDNLRDAVMKSLENLGNGFLSHPANDLLRQNLAEGKISSDNFSRLLRRVVYRLLFLMVSEERELIFPAMEESNLLNKEKGQEIRTVRSIYRRYYSISHFRQLVEKMYLIDLQQQNIWQELLVSFSVFEDESVSKNFGIGALNGDLFSYNAIAELNNCKLLNHDILEALHLLSIFKNENGTSTRINYKLLDVEELGSVYESLLDLHPLIETINGTLRFRFVSGMERKTTGSYYTRSDLVQEIIKSALEPVIQERLKSERKSSPAKGNSGEGLLKLKVCDPACGSGHFLLAAARCIARELAKIRSGDEQPTPTIYRQCLREVIQHCIYGVDMNPDAVELCKLALWLESHNSGKPLSFLDHKIRCGNSLVGITDLNVLTQPLPDEAFNSVTGDDKAVCVELKKINRAFQKTKQADLFTATGQQIKKDNAELQHDYHEIENIKQDTVADITEMKNRFGQIRLSVYHEEQACNIWTAAFFKTYTSVDDPTNPTSEKLIRYFLAPTQWGRLVGEAQRLASENKFFHWPLEFPDVFEQGGFDAMLGNPPWERIKLQEQEYFATRSPAIADAPNKAARERLIKELVNNQPQVFREFKEALHAAEAQSKYMRESGRFPLTARGDINTYSIFSEHFDSQINKNGRAGIIVPTGIATDDGNKAFFGLLVEENRLVTLFDFENTKKIFQGVHSGYKFSLLTIAGADIGNLKQRFGFQLTDVEHLQDKLRVFVLGKDDFLKLNPNTKTCPVFRTSKDAELTASIYNRVPILLNEKEGTNPWKMFIRQGLYHMTNDNNAGHIKSKLQNDFLEPIDLYEAKMMFQYDNHFANFIQGEFNYVDEKSSTMLSLGEYVVEKRELQERLDYLKWKRKWFFIYRNITKANQERTIIAAIVPLLAPVFSCRVLFSELETLKISFLMGQFNSVILDYFARQKVGGTNLSDYYTKQFPVLSPDIFDGKDLHFIIPRVLELTYTSWDIKSFADDVWNEADDDLRGVIMKLLAENTSVTGGHKYEPPTWLEHDKQVKLAPFKWDENRRAVLKAELDAYYAKLYGLTEEELRYILCPQDVYGENFPGETFRVLKDKEIRKLGEYRTKRLVMEAWERLNKQQILID